MAMLGGDMLECSPFDYSEGYDKCEDKYLSTIDSIVWYDGLGEIILGWKKLTPDEFTNYIKPDYRDKGYDEETVVSLELIWMMAVLMYGDYGTSPRSGWIKDISGFHRFIDKITTTYRRDLGEID